MPGRDIYLMSCEFLGERVIRHSRYTHIIPSNYLEKGAVFEGANTHLGSQQATTKDKGGCGYLSRELMLISSGVHSVLRSAESVQKGVQFLQTRIKTGRTVSGGNK